MLDVSEYTDIITGTFNIDNGKALRKITLAHELVGVQIISLSMPLGSPAHTSFGTVYVYGIPKAYEYKEVSREITPSLFDDLLNAGWSVSNWQYDHVSSQMRYLLRREVK